MSCTGLPDMPEDAPFAGPAEAEAEALMREERAESANASGRQLLRNFGAGYVSLLLSVAMSLLITPILLHRLGAADYGLWVTLILAGSYLGLLDSGVSTATVQRVAASLATGDGHEVALTLVTARRFFRLTALLALVVSFGVLPVVGAILHISPTSLNSARIAIPLVGLLTSVQFLTSTSTAGLFGAGRSDLLSAIGLVSSVAVQLGQIAVVLLGGGLPALAVAAVGGAGVSYIWSWRAQRRILPQQRARPSWATMRQLLRDGSRNMIVGLGGSLCYGIDSLIIASILPIQRVAPYDIAMSTATFTRSLSTAGTNMLLPTYAHTDAVGGSDRQFRLFASSITLSMTIATPIYVGLVAFGQPLLELWLGRVPPETFKVVAVLGLAYLLQLPGSQCFVFLTGIRKLRLLSWTAAPIAALNIALSFLLTPSLGPIGPVVGSLPQIGIIEFIVLPLLCARYLSRSPLQYFRQVMIPVVAIAVTSAALAVIILGILGRPSPGEAPFEAAAVVSASWLLGAATILRNATLRHKIRRSITTRFDRF